MRRPAAIRLDGLSHVFRQNPAPVWSEALGRALDDQPRGDVELSDAPGVVGGQIFAGQAVGRVSLAGEEVERLLGVAALGAWVPDLAVARVGLEPTRDGL